MKNYGEIIVATHYEMDKFGFRTGKRKARVVVSKDLERWQEIEIQTLIEGKEISAKGCVNIYYRGQPYICRSCQVKHCEKYPQQIAKQAAEKQAESTRVAQSKALLIGDSNLRRVNEKAFYARTDCATGAKIGHIANTLEYIDKEENQVIITHVGQNNVTQDDTVSINQWNKQTQYEIKALKTSLKKFKKVIVVGVPPAPWCKKTDKTKDMRNKINKALKTLAHDNMNIKYIDIEQEDEDDEANWEDERHMTEKFTGYVLGKISEKMQEIRGESFFIKNMPWTSERKYNQVRSTYKLGCEICTQMGHSQDSCTGTSSDTITSNPGTSTSTTSSAKKRGNCNGSDDPDPKKK